MNYLNLHTDILRSEAYLGAEPVERATWLNLMGWCATQENGGVIAGAESWRDRKWQQLCGITQAEAAICSQLYSFNAAGEMVVNLYPVDKEAEVKGKRNAGKIGGKAKTKAKSEASKQNGAKGGRPITQAETQAETQAKPKHNPSENPTEGKGKEGKGKEGKEKESPAALGLPHGEKFALAWSDWVQHRKEIRKPLKPTQTAAQLKNLGTMPEDEAVAMMLHTIEKGWQGLQSPETAKKTSHRTEKASREYEEPVKTIPILNR
jgi:hypothetical protein